MNDIRTAADNTYVPDPYKRFVMSKNSAIKCDVTSCKYNLNAEHYCSLESIKVGTHEANPTVPECTDCMSFVCKPSCCG